MTHCQMFQKVELPNNKENEDVQKVCKLMGRLGQKYQDFTMGLR